VIRALPLLCTGQSDSLLVTAMSPYPIIGTDEAASITGQPAPATARLRDRTE